MITEKQIADLKDALSRDNVAALIEKWEGEIFTREASKKGNVTFKLQNRKNPDDVRDVVGKQFGDDYVFHKDAYGGKSWVLTHTPTGTAIFQGKKTDVTQAVKNFIEWHGLGVFTNTLREYKLETLRKLPEHIVSEYREMYKLAQGY